MRQIRHLLHHRLRLPEVQHLHFQQAFCHPHWMNYLKFLSSTQVCFRYLVRSIVNYEFVYRHLLIFSAKQNFPLRIRPASRVSKRHLVIERRYWNNFYHQFSNYLYNNAGCYDNYVGSCFKTLRYFFNYLKEDRMIQVDDSYKKFHVRKEEIPVITLMPHQVKFLISDNDFTATLSKSMLRTRAVVIFGCTVALRFFDIFNVKLSDIQCIENRYYLSVRSKKTDTETRLQLPQYIIDLVAQQLSKK
jgi:hypothetical protein